MYDEITLFIIKVNKIFNNAILAYYSIYGQCNFIYEPIISLQLFKLGKDYSVTSRVLLIHNEIIL